MYVKVLIVFLLLKTLVITDATAVRANQLIQNICDTLNKNDSLQLDEDRQWKIICQELFDSPDENQHAVEQRDTMDEQNILPNKEMRKAPVRIGGARTSGIRGGSTIRGSRSPSITSSVYRNTRTGTTIRRPTGSQWSRTQLIFLPLATRYAYRSRSSSSRYTTPAASSIIYYYCTSTSDPLTEIQCNSANGDGQCCEEETTRQAYCCGGNIPDYILQDMNRATQTIARVFYTLTAIALCMHLFMRRFH